MLFLFCIYTAYSLKKIYQITGNLAYISEKTIPIWVLGYVRDSKAMVTLHIQAPSHLSAAPFSWKSWVNRTITTQFSGNHSILWASNDLPNNFKGTVYFFFRDRRIYLILWRPSGDLETSWFDLMVTVLQPWGIWSLSFTSSTLFDSCDNR